MLRVWLPRDTAGIIITIILVLFMPLYSYAEVSKRSIQGVIGTERVSCVETQHHKLKTGTVTVLNNHARLTAYHVVKDCEVVYIGNQPFKVTYIDPNHDIAVLGKQKDFRQLSCRAASKGESLNVTGYPIGSKQALKSKGISESSTGMKYASMEGLAIEGMSGGPVTSELGELLGLAKSRRGLFKVSYISGPNLCASLVNYEGALLSISS